MNTLAVDRELLTLTEEFYSLIKYLERQQSDAAAWVDAARRRYRELIEHVQITRERVADRFKGLHASLGQVSEQLRHHYDELKSDRAGEHIDEIRRSLAESYERLTEAIRSDARVRGLARKLHSIRPTNWWRNLFHVSTGVIGVAMYEWFLSWTGCLMVLIPLVVCWALMDISRRIWPRFNDLLINSVFAKIVRPRERYVVPSATWFAVSLLLVVLFAEQTVAQVAVLVLAFGDPVASQFGKRWGESKIIGEKSWVGSSAFFVASFLVVSAFLFAFRPFSLPVIFAWAGVAAAVGTLTELLATERLDDNLTIPVVVGLALMLIF